MPVLDSSGLVYLQAEVRGPEPEAELGGQDLLGLIHSARQGQHQSRLVHQLVLVVLVLQSPLQSLNCGEDERVKCFHLHLKHHLLFCGGDLIGIIVAVHSLRPFLSHAEQTLTWILFISLTSTQQHNFKRIDAFRTSRLSRLQPSADFPLRSVIVSLHQTIIGDAHARAAAHPALLPSLGWRSTCVLSCTMMALCTPV